MTANALFPTPEAAYEALQSMESAAAQLDGCAPLDSALVGVVRVAGVTKYIVLPFSSVGVVGPHYSERIAQELVGKLKAALTESAEGGQP